METYVEKLAIILIALSLCTACATPTPGGVGCVRIEPRPAGVVVTDRCVEWNFAPTKNFRSI